MGALMEKAVFKFGLEKLPNSRATSIFDFTVKDIDGKTINLKDYKGSQKGFIVTNVACACGLTG
jgi:hypothetical protein